MRGWRSIHITDGDHPYMAHWWVPGLQIGYEHTFVHQVADFLTGLASGESITPTFREALATDYVTDAVLKSAKSEQWERVKRRVGGVGCASGGEELEAIVCRPPTSLSPRSDRHLRKPLQRLPSPEAQATPPHTVTPGPGRRACGPGCSSP